MTQNKKIMKIAFDLVCTNVNSGSLTYLINILQGLKDYVPHKYIVIFLCKNKLNNACMPFYL